MRLTIALLLLAAMVLMIVYVIFLVLCGYVHHHLHPLQKIYEVESAARRLRRCGSRGIGQTRHFSIAVSQDRDRGAVHAFRRSGPLIPRQFQIRGFQLLPASGLPVL